MGWEKTTRSVLSHAVRRMPWLTRQRLAVFAVTLIAIGIAFEGINPTAESNSLTTTEADPEIVPLALPERLPRSDPSLTSAAGAPSREGDTESEWITVTVRSGQTLDGIFREQGFSATTLHSLVALDQNTAGLTKIRPGDVFEFIKDDEGQLLKMRYALNEAQHLLVSHVDGSLQADILEREILTEIEEAEGVITSSLFLAAKAAGLSDAMTINLAGIFGWDVDFALDIREGDRFFLVYEKLYRDGEFLRDGNILAATFINQGQKHQAVRYETGNGADYYGADGRTLRKEFLRAPLNFRYISSAFNPRRMHPILKRLRPHNGIDYYAPRGTPVYAAGEGTVIRSAYSNANGHHVFIKHDNNIETRYLHFTNRAVKQGQRVSQGQTIGYVGSTGLATGPHLHYEFLVNGTHVNPRTVPLPKVEPLVGDALMAFHQQAAPMLTRLSRLESASLYASAE